MGLPSVLITGASGFVGDRLLQQIGSEPAHTYCISRSLSPRMRSLAEQGRGTCLQLDLATGELPNELAGEVDTVIHLAAATGKARRAQYFATNVRGTDALLHRCARWGVRQFVFVSTIATQFKDLRRYHYAQSKREAERVVAASGMPYVIVRPTIVAGQGSGAWQGLLKLARAPITPIFGNGRARLQPIHVDDLVDALLHVVRERKFANEAIDLGGPEVIDVESLLRRMRQAVGRRPGPVIHLPLRTTRKLLGNLERPLFPLLPMTAGQLSVFAEDSTAAASSLWQRLAPRMKRIDEMIAGAAETAVSSHEG